MRRLRSSTSSKVVNRSGFMSRVLTRRGSGIQPYGSRTGTECRALVLLEGFVLVDPAIVLIWDCRLRTVFTSS